MTPTLAARVEPGGPWHVLTEGRDSTLCALQVTAFASTLEDPTYMVEPNICSTCKAAIA